MRMWILLAGSWLGAASGLIQAAERTPPGVGIRMTYLGPTFVDMRGMTLYRKDAELTAGRLSCPDLPETVIPIGNVGYNQVGEFPVQVPDAASRRSCIEKYPLFLAGKGAKRIGHWTIHVRPNGATQWAYRGKPVHFSIKDRAPGELNATYSQYSRNPLWDIAAPLLEAPVGVETRLTSRGLAFTTHAGKALYHLASGRRAERNENMKPFWAPAAASADQLPDEWSIVTSEGGLPQWGWKGKLLYIYVGDDGDRRPFVDTFGHTYGKSIPGWQVALVKAAPPPPEQVRVVTLPYPTQKIYADTRGKPLYAISCRELTNDRLDCDDVGDSPRHWLSFCGGEERCMKTWQPLRAPTDAKPIEGLWSTSVINPRHPYKALKEEEAGITVWSYRGRLLFTYAEDEKLGEARGTRAFYSPGMAADVVPAFAPPSEAWEIHPSDAG